MFCRRLIVLGVLSLTCFGADSAWAVVTYTVTEIGALPYGHYFRPRDINDDGQVVGSFGVKGGVGAEAIHGFLYADGVTVDLGTLGGRSSTAGGINSDGDVVGTSDAPSGSNIPFLYTNGTMTSLGTLPGGSRGQGYDINDLGQVAGWSETDNGYNRAFRYTDGTMSDLGTLAGYDYSYGYAINAGGDVVGVLTHGGVDYNSHAFLYRSGTMVDLGTPAGCSGSVAVDINAAGQVVGRAYPHTTTASHPQHAFLYSNGTMTDLGTLGGTNSSAHGINDFGEVVGTTVTDYSRYNVAFLYSNGTMTDLNTLVDPSLNWDLNWASAINNNGQICGYGTNPSGQSAAFLLTPIPEPSSFVFLVLGVAGMIAYRRRRPRYSA